MRHASKCEAELQENTLKNQIQSKNEIISSKTGKDRANLISRIEFVSTV